MNSKNAGGDSKHHDTRQRESVLVDVLGLNRVKENYMEETLLIKLEAPKPVVVGYSVLPLLIDVQQLMV